MLHNERNLNLFALHATQFWKKYSFVAIMIYFSVVSVIDTLGIQNIGAPDFQRLLFIFVIITAVLHLRFIHHKIGSIVEMYDRWICRNT